MTLRRSGVQAACLAIFTPLAAAQDFNYPDFSSVAGLSMNGNAGQFGNVLRVTPAANGQKGSVYYDQATRVTGGFKTTFTFQFSAFTSGGADGMTFIIQNAPEGLNALGDDGSGMGYAENPNTSIHNCIAVEFDTWNSGFGDPDANHVSVHTGGTGNSSFDEAFSLGRATVTGDMSDGAVHTAVIRYEGGMFEVFVDDLINPLISVPYDFITGGTYTDGTPVGGLSLINGESAYVGFTGATGGANENHDVLSWEWQDAYGPIGTNYCQPANKNSTGLSALISAFGSESVAANRLELIASQLPPNVFGYFLNSDVQGFQPFPPGSSGNLCLAGGIGGHVKQIAKSNAAGEIVIDVDLTILPRPGGTHSVVAGETWNFQCWFRDKSSGVPTSNFTDGIEILYQ